MLTLTGRRLGMETDSDMPTLILCSAACVTRRYQPDMAKLHSNGMLVIEEVKSFPGTMYLSACSGVIIPKIQVRILSSHHTDSCLTAVCRRWP